MGRLTAAQLQDLLALPTDPTILDRFWSLTEGDIAFIKHPARDDANRLGCAIHLCALRFPGRSVRPHEIVPEAAIAYLCMQLGLDANKVGPHGRRTQTRSDHFNQIARRYRYRQMSQPDKITLLKALRPVALGTVSAFALARFFMEECRRRGIAVPAATAIDHLISQSMIRAEDEVYSALTEKLTSVQKRRLDALTIVPKGEKESPKARCGAKPGTAGPDALRDLAQRRALLTAIGLDPDWLAVVHPARIRALWTEADGADAQRLRGGSGGIARSRRRYALLVVFTVETATHLADTLVDMFLTCIGGLFQRAQHREEQALLKNAKTINDKLAHYLGVLEAIQGGAPIGLAAIDAFAAVLSPARLEREITETRALLRPSGPTYADIANRRRKTIRGIGRAFIPACTFEAKPMAAPLLAAVETLRTFYSEDDSAPPLDPPSTFMSPDWRKIVLTNGVVETFELYEFCVLCALRERLRAGDIAVNGAREYRAVEDQMLAPALIAEMEAKGGLPIPAPRDPDDWLDERRATMARRLDEVAAAAAGGALEDVRLKGDRLIITPLRKDVPPEAQRLARRIGDRLPEIRITELLVDVMRETGAADAFTHFRTGKPPLNLEIVLAALLARATNIGLTRMARSSTIATVGKLREAENAHLHADALKAALACVVGSYQSLPMATLLGDGKRSSSDGQLFGLAGPGESVGAVNPHKSARLSISIYSHISDQWAPFHARVISASESEAAHVVDGLLHHGTAIESAIHHTDGAGATDHVFGLCHLLGFAFQPRIPNMHDRRLYTFTSATEHGVLAPFIAGRIDEARIRAHWDDLRRAAVSMRLGALSAATFLKRLAAYPLQNGLGLALRELGRIERTLFSLDWFSDPDLRRSATRVLNRGESRHALAKAIASHQHGLFQQGNLTALQHCASALNLVTMAIIYWNAREIEAAAKRLPDGDAPPALLRHVSPVIWEHIALEGHYFWPTELERLFGPNGAPRDPA